MNIETRARKRNRGRVSATRRSERQIALTERAVADLAPEVWKAVTPPLLRWLRATLQEVRPQLEQLVIEQRALSPERLYLQSLLENYRFEDAPLDRLQPIVQEMTTGISLEYGFLPDDPRTEVLERDLKGLIESDMLSFWRGRTDPATLARRVTTLREEGLGVEAMSRQLAAQYQGDFYSAERLIRTAYTSGANAAHTADLEAQGYTHLKWITARDSRVRAGGRSNANHRRMEGVSVPIGEPFVTPLGSRLRYPGDRGLGAQVADVVNCRCTVIGVVEGERPAQPTPPQVSESAPTPSPQPRYEPQGTPVGEGLTLEPGPRSKLGKSLRHTLEMIEKTHGDGVLTNIPVQQSSGKSTLGAFRYYRGGQPVRIQVSKNSPYPELTFAHEVGHFLDYQGVGTLGRYASESDARLEPWRDAVANSRAVNELQELLQKGTVRVTDENGVPSGYTVNKRHVRYLLQKRELWARAYSQYVATRQRDPVTLEQLAFVKGRSNRYAASQWDDDDFEPIAAEMDRLFERLGWISSESTPKS